MTRGDILKIISVKAKMTPITTWCFFKKGKTIVVASLETLST